MKRPASILCLLLAGALLAGAEGRNSYPIVLVHGFLGFGQGELARLNYWGGTRDLAGELRARGYEAYAASIGPLASNWDRACELYACIKGGTVDYGEAHAQAYGHARYGRTYPGLYPDWGPERKVHLLGHSMGGQTSRTLVQLLEEGSPGEGSGELFRGGKIGRDAWVLSVTTLATPHDGSTLAYRYELSDRFLRGLFALAAYLARSGEEPVFDFKLDQWGLDRKPEERFSTYRKRILSADLWWRSKDIAPSDLSPEGARELNNWVRARPDVYYFSWAAEETFREPFTGHEVPEPGMIPILEPACRFIGSFKRDDPGSVPIDRAWWPNDGMVSTISMDGPSLGSTDRIVPYGGEPLPGAWNFMGVLPSFDHLDFIGLPRIREKPKGYSDLLEWYAAIADLLAGLSPPEGGLLLEASLLGPAP